MKKYVKLLSYITALLIIFTACSGNSAKNTKSTQGKSEDAADYMAVADEINYHAADIDGDIHLYKKALDTTSDYLSEKVSKADAIEDITAIKSELKSRMDSITKYTMTDNMKKLFSVCDIIPEEFESSVLLRRSYIQAYISDLENICTYLNDAEEYEFMYNNLVFTHENNVKTYDIERNTLFYSHINYWYAPWTGDMLDYAKDNPSDSLKVLNPKEYKWYSDRDEINDSVLVSYNEKLSDIVLSLSERVAQEEESLMDLQNNIEEFISGQKTIKALPYVTEELKRTLNPLDNDCTAIDEGMTYAQKYVNGETDKKEALAGLKKAITDTETALESVSEYKMPEDVKNYFKECNISITGYELLVNVFTIRNDNLYDLKRIYYCIKEDYFSDEDVAFYYENTNKKNAAHKKYAIAIAGLLFKPCREECIQAVDAQVLNKLKYYYIKDFDKTSESQNTDIYLDDSSKYSRIMSDKWKPQLEKAQKSK